MFERELDRRFKVAELAAAVVRHALELIRVHGFLDEQRGDAIRELYLAASTAARSLEQLEDARCEDVTSDDAEIRRRHGGRRLLDDPLHFAEPFVIGLDLHDAVLVRLLGRYGLHSEHAALVTRKHLGHLAQARNLSADEVVREMHREGLIADGRPRTEDGVA